MRRVFIDTAILIGVVVVEAAFSPIVWAMNDGAPRGRRRKPSYNLGDTATRLSRIPQRPIFGTCPFALANPAAKLSPPPVTLIVGYSCSGKTTAIRMLKNKGYWVIEASDYLKLALNDRSAKLSTDDIRLAVQCLGKDFVARQIVSQSAVFHCAHARGDEVFIAGFRLVEEAAYFQTRFPTRIVAILAHDMLRQRRSRLTNLSKRITRKEDFQRRTFAEYALGLSQLIQKADQTVVNNSSLADFAKHVDRLTDRTL